MKESNLIRGEEAPLLFGHRGCPGLAPENTLSSFQKALDCGLPGVELDVQICATGELLVYHDTNLQRTTGFNGKLVDHDFSQIRSLDNGSFFSPRFAGEKIPLLDEVFTLLGSRVYYDIELKADDITARGLEEKTLEMIRDFHLEKRVLISSFNPLCLRRFSRMAPDIPLFLIYSNTEDVPFYLRKGEGRYLAPVRGIKPENTLLDEKLYNRFSRKYSLMTWTVDDRNEYNRVIDLGVEGICTNRGDLFGSGEFIDK